MRRLRVEINIPLYPGNDIVVGPSILGISHAHISRCFGISSTDDCLYSERRQMHIQKPGKGTSHPTNRLCERRHHRQPALFQRIRFLNNIHNWTINFGTLSNNSSPFARAIQPKNPHPPLFYLATQREGSHTNTSTSTETRMASQALGSHKFADAKIFLHVVYIPKLFRLPSPPRWSSACS